MENSQLELIKIGASLLGGGAIGAIITAFVTNHRNRIQPVGKTLRIETVFSPGKIFKDHLTKITFSGATENYHFDNLYIVQMPIVNLGNKDYTEFNFGITLPQGAKAVNIKTKGSDRHHVIEVAQEIDFNTPKDIIDFTLKPFNRNDIYHVSLFITCLNNNNNLENISFSSDMAVKFKEINVIPETTAALFEEIIKRIAVFPFK